MTAKVNYFIQTDLDKNQIARMMEGKWQANEPVMVKMHFGEPGNKTALDLETVQPYVEVLKELGHEVVLWDCPVFYPSPRQTKAGYEQVIKDKGFDQLAKCEVCDDYVEVTLPDGKIAKVAKILTEAKNSMTLTHVKGHGLAGFGGSIKNIGIGAVAPETKGLVHEVNQPGDRFGFNVDILGEVVAAAVSLMPKNQLYFNIIKNVTQWCDCTVDAGEMIAPNIGTLVSDNLVAIDQASLDLINETVGSNIFLEKNKLDPQGHIDSTALATGLTKEYLLQPEQ